MKKPPLRWGGFFYSVGFIFGAFFILGAGQARTLWNKQAFNAVHPLSC